MRANLEAHDNPDMFGGHGGAIHVQHGDTVLFSEGIGKISPYRNQMWGRLTQSGIRSCTKTMLGALAMKAKERGQIAFSDQIGSYSSIYDRFNGYTLLNNWGQTTLDLTRTIDDYMSLTSVSGATGLTANAEQLTLDDCMTEYQTHCGQGTGTNWNYNDVSLRIVAAILIEATGERLQDLFDEMFETLGMTNTVHCYNSHPTSNYNGFFAKGEAPPANYADEVLWNGTAYEWEPAMAPETRLGISGVITTAVDHARFWQGVTTPNLWLTLTNINLWLQAHTGHADSSAGVSELYAPFVNYGYGAYKADIAGQTGWAAYGYGGGGGQGGCSVYLPTDDFVVALTSNAFGIHPTSGNAEDDLAVVIAEDWVTNVRT